MLQKLFEIIEKRKKKAPKESYTAQLMAKGEDKVLQKIGEEAAELIVAAKGQGDKRIIEEMADLYYHTLVLLSLKGLTLKDVEKELRNRHKK